MSFSAFFTRSCVRNIRLISLQSPIDGLQGVVVQPTGKLNQKTLWQTPSWNRIINPNSADQRHQTLSPVYLTAQPQHTTLQNHLGTYLAIASVDLTDDISKYHMLVVCCWVRLAVFGVGAQSYVIPLEGLRNTRHKKGKTHKEMCVVKLSRYTVK